ncbi:DUF4435 domain-containing protein [Methylicorpusculum sp.]|uniref:DUF4435 domain-containing protein n=1 Tax=Methylicorpusculum sp. TaxID=2713644 RepID=UPI00272F9C5C|nr:DUF4435 domain-containing protein [Methylicorpusculum sp.]MDP2180571.1 DUF4435 domain-containing protein [Methylicorpusculum sp.]MDP3527731.1 DUF4435 domain-containing protein [Methylicorpusculum sp.]
MSGTSFKALGNKVYEEYTDGIKVYLESTDDEYIVGRKWFPHLKDKISFESVSDVRANGGCQLVRKKVKESKANNKKSFGIVDRDILLADPLFRDSLWWQIDNDIFTSTKPYEEGDIFVLHYWELENYLLHPKALESLLSDKKLAKNSAFSESTIAGLLFQHENDLVAVTLLSTISAQQALDQAPIGFGLDNFGDELTEKVRNKLHISMKVSEIERQKIKNFAEDESNALIRWNKLSRILDGKRIIQRIDRLFSGKDRADCKVSLTSERGALAGYIASHKLIEPNLVKWIESIYNSTNSALSRG